MLSAHNGGNDDDDCGKDDNEDSNNINQVEGDHLVIQYRPPHHPGHYEPAFPVRFSPSQSSLDHRINHIELHKDATVQVPGYNHHVHPLPYHETKHVSHISLIIIKRSKSISRDSVTPS